MTREVSNHDDVIDSRDVIARIEELEAIEAEHKEAVENAEGAEKVEAEMTLTEWTHGEEGEELATLRKLADEASGSPDWIHGETLIRESYFQTYAEELADDIGAIPKDLAWPCTCIDWEQAARELQMDYIEADYAGVTYLIRA